MIDESSEIYQIIENNFPRLPGMDEWNGGLEHHDAVEFFFAGLAHNAVNSNAVNHMQYKHHIRNWAVEILINGQDLPKSLRAWIAYVLRNLDDKGFPDRRNGHPIDPFRKIEQMDVLAQKVMRYKSGLPVGEKFSRTKMLEDIERETPSPGQKLKLPALGCEKKIANLYDSQEYKDYCAMFYPGQDITPKKRQAKKNGPTKGPAKKGQ